MPLLNLVKEDTLSPDVYLSDEILAHSKNLETLWEFIISSSNFIVSTFI